MRDFVHLDRCCILLHLLLTRLSCILFDHKFEIYLNKFKLQCLSCSLFQIYIFLCKNNIENNQSLYSTSSEMSYRLWKCWNKTFLENSRSPAPIRPFATQPCASLRDPEDSIWGWKFWKVEIEIPAKWERCESEDNKTLKRRRSWTSRIDLLWFPWSFFVSKKTNTTWLHI